jgi:hypothetical protein
MGCKNLKIIFSLPEYPQLLVHPPLLHFGCFLVVGVVVGDDASGLASTTMTIGDR